MVLLGGSRREDKGAEEVMERTDPANNSRCDYIKKKYQGNS